MFRPRLSRILLVWWRLIANMAPVMCCLGCILIILLQLLCLCLQRPVRYLRRIQSVRRLLTLLILPILRNNRVLEGVSFFSSLQVALHLSVVPSNLGVILCLLHFLSSLSRAPLPCRHPILLDYIRATKRCGSRQFPIILQLILPII